MDREAAVIRAEMTQTRAELDHKLTLLEGRARQLSPRRYATQARQYLPEYPVERTVGSLLTLIGVGMAVTQYRRVRRRDRLRKSMAAYASCWSQPAVVMPTEFP